MCGIAGFCLNPKEHQRASINDLAGQMLLDIEHRGQHATGCAWIDSRTGTRTIRKAPLPATSFVQRAKNLCNNAQTAILHTRWATQGSPKDNNNNHPIPRGKIVLTHNGHIANDDALFKQLNVKRHALVDSEAVTALLAFSNSHPSQALTEVRGTAALAWIEQDAADILHLARVNSSPLWIGMTPLGSLVYGSTEETIENAAIILGTDLNWKYRASEGEYFKVRNGNIVEYESFKPKREERDYNWRTMSYLRDEELDKWWQNQDELAF